MERHQFLNRIRSLFCIDAWDLPELTDAQRTAFVADPVKFLIHADDATADVIWRAVQKRQRT